MLTTAFDIIFGKVSGWWKDGVSMFPNLVVAVIIFIVFLLVAKYLKRLIRKFFERFYGQTAVINLFSNVVYLLILTTGLFVSLGILNLDKTVTSLLAGLGILGLAIGFALSFFFLKGKRNTRPIIR